MGEGPESKPNQRICVGLLAHVDAGKTTLSEGLLYESGQLKKLGRVDHRDAFLDTDALERERGITIFSKQAVLPLETAELTLLDTPGHVDFSAEMERTLQVLDCAILVISGTDGVQGHTQTLWKLLARYGVPTFIFINKMDLDGTQPAALLEELKARLDGGCVDFGKTGPALWEEVALCGEAALNRYLETGTLTDRDVAGLIGRRALFPCWFGSALKLTGVAEFLRGLERYAPRPRYPADFGAKVFKIARDPQGNRLTYLKVTGGNLVVKSPLTNRRAGLAPEQVWEEKVDQIRIYSGAKFQTVDQAGAGTVCAVTGLSATRAGDRLGIEALAETPALEPVLTYQVILPDGCEPHTALQKLRLLEEEDPQLHLIWNERLREIHIQLMGEVQLEILQRLIGSRFGLEVSFGMGGILYKETIAAPVEGVGHFEPLRHYAEVHLLLEPGERGSGLRFMSACPEDELDRNWQRLILTHLEEKSHLGVLTGAPITDLRITLVAGRAHVKHTEGGYFRQATYRAVRQGLMEAQSILLEPWYDFRLELPTEHLGRAMSDLQQMSGRADPPEMIGTTTILTGRAPVNALRDYARQVRSYTGGRGRLFCSPRGYEPCPNQEAVVTALGYDPERDVENPADSVFCTHGAGVTVKWDQVKAHMHVDSGLRLAPREEEPEPEAPSRPRRSSYTDLAAEDKELQAIFERTYGPVKRKDFQPQRKAATPASNAPRPGEGPRYEPPDYLLADGYNLIFAWEDLKALARDNLDLARTTLMDMLSNYQGFQRCEVILVFDAYKVPHGTGEVSRYHNIHVVYTREAETADAYIEKVTYQLGKKHRVRVATSDGIEQLIILGHGALRLSARAFRAELDQVTGQIRAALAGPGGQDRSRPVQAALERAQAMREKDGPP